MSARQPWVTPVYLRACRGRVEQFRCGGVIRYSSFTAKCYHATREEAIRHAQERPALESATAKALSMAQAQA